MDSPDRHDLSEVLTKVLGHEVADVDEETFDLFSHVDSSQDLGMLDPHADQVEVTIAGKDFTIKQSPGILQSNRDAGTTGAVIWRTSIRFAEWLHQSDNFLFRSDILGTASAVLELGTGISALVPLSLRGKVERIVATDQQYALKLLQENVTANSDPAKSKNKSRSKPSTGTPESSSVEVLALDWETDDIPSFLHVNKFDEGVDAVLVCDCVFNYALIEPLVTACADICRVRVRNREADDRGGKAPMHPTVCIIAQQLRQPDVFEQWLRAFSAHFRVWRVPADLLLTEGGGGSSGFVIHVGVLRYM